MRFTTQLFSSLFLVFLVSGISLPIDAQTKPVANSDTFSSSSDMKAANDAASKLLEERMKKDRPLDLDILKKVKESEVIIVRGVYDHAETVLSAVKVPHLVVDTQDLDRIDLNAKQLLIVNCPGIVSDKAIEKIRKFVKAGGFLFTTDWSLKNVLEKAFPGYVSFPGRPTTDDVVAVHILKTDNPLLQHVKTTDDAPKWWLESSSYPIHVIDTKQVEVLMESSEMKKKYGESPIAVHFKYGDGEVLHIVSHYYLQRTETRTVSEKDKGTEFSKYLGLGNDNAAASDLAKTTMGAVKDAYAAQQFSTNVIVNKQKKNKELEAVYNYRAEATIAVYEKPSAASKKIIELKKDAELKMLEKKDAWSKVQTLNGDEGWVENAKIKLR